MRIHGYGLWIVVMLALATSVVVACSSADSEDEADGEAGAAAPADSAGPAVDDGTPYVLQQAFGLTMSVTTTSMSDRFGRFDQDNTCEGQDLSPQLTWEGVPADAKSVALILDDLKSDETNGLWTHWVLYSIPPSVTELTAGEVTTDVLASGAKHGTNDFENVHYSGPCPRPLVIATKLSGNDQSGGSHTAQISDERPYYFRLYALDKEIDLEPGATRNALLREMDGHIIAGGEVALPYKTRKRAARVN